MSLTSIYQNSRLLEDFEDHFNDLLQLIIEHNADDDLGSPCSCGNGIRTTQCHDCTQYQITCTGCFVRGHQTNPFHWAEVWDLDRGFFVRRDISTLGAVIYLGHKGAHCPNPLNNILFTVVDSNGVHGTRLSFCGCLGAGGKIKQLMKARLFPATTRDPKTAFTFKVLKEFHLHNLESKKAAYDYLGAIRRLTDNAFMADVLVSLIHSYPEKSWRDNVAQDPAMNFYRVVRVWRLLILLMHLGQAHGIDNVLLHRRLQNLIVHCPACPEPGFNTEKEGKKTPFHLRYYLLHRGKAHSLMDNFTGISISRKRLSMAISNAIR